MVRPFLAASAVTTRQTSSSSPEMMPIFSSFLSSAKAGAETVVTATATVASAASATRREKILFSKIFFDMVFLLSRLGGSASKHQRFCDQDRKCRFYEQRMAIYEAEPRGTFPIADPRS